MMIAATVLLALLAGSCAAPEDTRDAAATPGASVRPAVPVRVVLEEPGATLGESAPPPERGFAADVEERLMAMINAQRDARGLPALETEPGLAGAARLRAMEMVQGGYLSHCRPDGSAWYRVLEEEFPFACTGKGENIARQDGERASPRNWFGQWELSPSDCENMFYSGFDRIGVGIYEDARGGSYRSAAVVLFAQTGDPVTDR